MSYCEEYDWKFDLYMYLRMKEIVQQARSGIWETKDGAKNEEEQR